MKKLLLSALAVFTLTSPAMAGRLTNIDGEPRTVTITYLGNSKRQVTLNPSESEMLIGPWMELTLPGSQPVMIDGRNEYAIRKGRVELVRYYNRNGRGN